MAAKTLLTARDVGPDHRQVFPPDSVRTGLLFDRLVHRGHSHDLAQKRFQNRGQVQQIPRRFWHIHGVQNRSGGVPITLMGEHIETRRFFDRILVAENNPHRQAQRHFLNEEVDAFFAVDFTQQEHRLPSFLDRALFVFDGRNECLGDFILISLDSRDVCLPRVWFGQVDCGWGPSDAHVKHTNQEETGGTDSQTVGIKATPGERVDVKTKKQQSEEASGGRSSQSVTFNITTPDADSFRKSEGQVARQMQLALNRGARNL